ncbi:MULTISPECIES: VWA domain-containing protein [Thiorhodovibrio]|uniref:VWA domain-containing protein n=1 Tax=Thiorhodovibrio TaxID=61593 RepID=UPI00191488E1|nr:MULTISPECIES: VWA domain-containing protein [Thiorhodovibrio]MBK5970315.1 VWA domain-containing protein [Thiorhodovibrio winogradskyi]
MFSFAAPWAILLLPLPWLLWWLASRSFASPGLTWLRAWLLAMRPSAPVTRRLLHPHLEHLRSAYQGRSWAGSAGARLRLMLLALLWTSLVVALMRPQWLEPVTEISTPGYDLMLAVDASHSMDALDFSVQGQQVSRMAVVKGVMGRFVAGRTGDRVGLIVFGSAAYQLSPLTLDRSAVRQLLETLVPGIAGSSTALGDALALGAKKLKARPPGSRVMILIADGDNTDGDFQPLEAAALAREFGVRIYVVGVGSQDARIPILHRGRIEYWDDLTMDETTLRAIAETTGGAYFRATDTSALEAISARISALEPSDAETRTAFVPRALYRWPLLAALLALAWLGLLRALAPPALAQSGGEGTLP